MSIDGTPIYEVVVEESRMITIRFVHTVLGGDVESALKRGQYAANTQWEEINENPWVILGPKLD